MRWTLTLLAVAMLSACANSTAPGVSADAWPEADALFHRDPRWLGADAAFSVSLGNGRVLWLFGDTFVATSERRVRSESRLVRNSVAVQTGLDPSRADITFHWRQPAATPQSFFPEDGAIWRWPAHGVRLPSALVLFVMRVRATPGEGLGFRADGWEAVRIPNPDDPPPAWRLEWLPAPREAIPGLVVGAAVVRDGDHVLALSVREPGNHAGYLARFRTADLADGRLAAEWWDGVRWGGGATPAEVMSDAGAESSLHQAADGRWVHVRSQGFGATTIVLAEAASVLGPWRDWQSIYRPPESDRPGAFVYAGKAHPELEGGGLVVTYAANGFDFAEVVRDTSLYYPRFVRVTGAPR